MEQKEILVKDLDPEQEKMLRLQRIWLSRIEYEREAHKDYRERAKEVDQVYRNDFQNEEDTLLIPLYWSVVNVEHVGIYSNQPVPDIRPANEHSTEIFSQVARLMERGCRGVVNERSFDFSAHRAVTDYLALGLGVMRAKVDTEYMDQRIPSPEEADPMTIMTAMQAPPEIKNQRIRWEYVPYDHFMWEPCNNLENCTWIGFRHSMTKTEIRDRFGADIDAGKTDQNNTSNAYSKRLHDIYEIWDKEKKKVYFISENEAEPLEVADDPFGLYDFFPCVTMWGCLQSGQIIPQPDYDFVEPYDVELNRLQARRMALLDQIRAAGAYDSSFTELQNMFELDDGKYQGIDNLSQRMNTMGGVDNAIYHLPLEEKAAVLNQLTQQMQFVKAQVDDILGISDIVRGVTKASESATAADIKGRWVGIRLSGKRETVMYAMREVMRITSQLLANVITPENLTKMTQMPITAQMYQLLQDKVLTHFAIDVETESTIAKDEMEDRRTHQEMLNGIAQFSQAVLPMVQQNLMPADISSAILKSALRPYARYDRSLDEALKNLPTSTQQLQQANQQIQQQGQQIQQMGQQLQQLTAILNQLQQQAQEAKTQRELADARKKEAEAEKITAETKDARVKPYETAAKTDKLLAETEDIRRGEYYG